MEQNIPIVANKFRNIIRTLYLVLRKEISKGKLLFDLNMALNRTKMANKLSSIRNVMFHHSAVAVKHQLSRPNAPINENGRDVNIHVKKRKPHEVMLSSTDALIVASPLDIFNRAGTSPTLAGFGPSLRVKQVRISDSPSPLREGDQDYIHVDEAAEEFIKKFYQNLRQQN